jgi:hypothetical protein
MSRATKNEWIRCLMGTSEPPSATEHTEGGAEAEAEASSKAMPPPTMSELIRSRPRRHVGLFDRPSAEAATADDSTETPPQDMNALIRARGRRHAALFDEPAAVDPKE